MKNPLLNGNNSVIVIESSIRSLSFLNFLKKTIVNILKSNKFAVNSIKKEGHYLIVYLQNDSYLVHAMELLKKISGISYIFIGVTEDLDYDTLSKNIVSIGIKLLTEGEKYVIKIETSKISNINDEAFLNFRNDLEFYVQSEISSLSKKLICVNDEKMADKILYVVIGSNIAFISLLVERGQDITPFNFLNDIIICPLYSNTSLLSLIQTLNAGYFPLPIFFYLNRLHLIGLLKTFDNIIMKYPIHNIDIHLFDVRDIEGEEGRLIIKAIEHDLSKYNDTNVRDLFFEQVIINILVASDFNNNFVSLPLMPYIHPHWFIKKNILQINQSNKVLLTPLLFNYPLQMYKKNIPNLDDSRYLTDVNHVLKEYSIDIDQVYFEKIITKFLKAFRVQSKHYRKFHLNMRHNDILDILDTV